MELTYRREGDYLLPNLTVPESPKIGKYGMLRCEYLRNHKKGIYTGMMLSGRLNSHLEEIDRRAAERVESLTTEMAKAERVTEDLKVSDQMLWVQQMNNIRSRAEEIVLTEMIYE